MTDLTQTASPAKPWERLPDEPARWFWRFTAFRLMGVNRTMLGCVNSEKEEKGKKKKSKCTPGSWDVAAEQWNWRERAAAWDAAELERIEAETQRIRDERRRKTVDHEWLQARTLADAAERCFTEVAALARLGKRRMVRDEPIECGGNGQVRTERITVEVDAVALLGIGRRLVETVSLLMRRAADMPVAGSGNSAAPQRSYGDILARALAAVASDDAEEQKYAAIAAERLRELAEMALDDDSNV